MSRNTVWATLAMSAVLCISGCTSDAGVPKVKVKGVVTYNGDVLSEGAIKFTPVSGVGPTTGAIIEEGNYSADVPPEPMRVEITSPKVTGTRKAYDTPDSPMVDITEEMIPTRYNTKTELKFDPSDSMEGDFDLKRDAK